MYNISGKIKKDSGLSIPRIVCEKERKIHCDHSFNLWNNKKKQLQCENYTKKLIYKWSKLKEKNIFN